MKMSKEEYDLYVKSITPRSPLGRDMLCAFAIGGLQDVIHPLVTADVDTEAALHPQHLLEQTLGIIGIRLRHLFGAVDVCVHRGDLPAAALDSQRERLVGGGRKGFII